MLAQHALTEAKLVRQLHRAYDFLVAERQLPGLAQRGNFKGVRNCKVKFHEVRLITDGAPPVGATTLSSSPGSYGNMAHIDIVRRSACLIAKSKTADLRHYGPWLMVRRSSKQFRDASIKEGALQDKVKTEQSNDKEHHSTTGG